MQHENYCNTGGDKQTPAVPLHIPDQTQDRGKAG